MYKLIFTLMLFTVLNAHSEEYKYFKFHVGEPTFQVAKRVNGEYVSQHVDNINGSRIVINQDDLAGNSNPVKAFVAVNGVVSSDIGPIYMYRGSLRRYFEESSASEDPLEAMVQNIDNLFENITGEKPNLPSINEMNEAISGNLLSPLLKCEEPTHASPEPVEPQVNYLHRLDARGLSTDASYNFRAAEDIALNIPISCHLQTVPRTQWNARRPRQNRSELQNPTKIVIHHTAGRIDETPRSVQDYHMNSRNFNDVGYNYLIGYDQSQRRWRVYDGATKLNSAGVSVPVRGAHTLGKNSRTIGITIIGNFSPYHSVVNPTGYNRRTPENLKQPPPEAAKQLAELIRSLMARYPSINDIVGHGGHSTSAYNHRTYNIDHTHTSDKDCPGEGVVHIAAAMRQRFIEGEGQGRQCQN